MADPKDKTTPQETPETETPVNGAGLSKEEIKAKMLEYAKECMDRYDDALRELAK
jgi:hypothetical protein